MEKIRIKTPSRLHLGFLDLKARTEVGYNSVGVAIEKPNFIIETEISDTLKIEGILKRRALHYAKQFIKNFNLKERVKIKLLACIPEHVGLGSGTQLALGIGCAITRLFDLKTSIDEIAHIAGRGNVSGIGIHAFESGGFIVDNLGENFHYPLPDNWYWIITILKNGKGISGRTEGYTFKNLPKISEETVHKLHEMVSKKMIQSVINSDITSFGETVTELDKKNGELFSQSQKGTYFSKDVEEGIEILLKNNAYAAGQSSWGPSFYGLSNGGKNALKLKDKLEMFFCDKANVFITNTNNKGVEIGWLEH